MKKNPIHTPVYKFYNVSYLRGEVDGLLSWRGCLFCDYGVSLCFSLCFFVSAFLFEYPALSIPSRIRLWNGTTPCGRRSIGNRCQWFRDARGGNINWQMHARCTVVIAIHGGSCEWWGGGSAYIILLGAFGQIWRMFNTGHMWGYDMMWFSQWLYVARYLWHL